MLSDRRWCFIGLKQSETSSSAVAKRPRDASCLSVVSFVASIVQYSERSFFIIRYFSFGFTSVYNSILFCCLRRNVKPCCLTYDLSWLCIVRERAWSFSRWRTKQTGWLYRAWRLVVEYPQYMTSDISVTTCKMVAVVHRRPCLQHLACCSVNSRHRLSIAISA